MKSFLKTLIVCAVLFSPTFLQAYPDIKIENISLQMETPNKYLLFGNVKNETDKTKEVILRGQLTFYDRSSPKGDVPAAIIRKDITIILKAGEARNLEIILLNEGTTPEGALRMEPNIWLRRQKDWNYE